MRVLSGELDIGNGYRIIKEDLIASNLRKEFDYTDDGIRRLYQTAVFKNENNSVAVLIKDDEYECELNNTGFNHINDEILKFENKELRYIDEKMRLIRFYSDNTFNIRELNIINIIDNNLYIHHRIPFPDVINHQIILS